MREGSTSDEFPAEADSAAGERFDAPTLAETFRDVFLSERTGMLDVRGESGTVRIHFERGLIQFAEADDPRLSLGALLIEEGRISPGALAEAEREARSTAEIARALVNRGLVSKAPLHAAVRTLTDRIVAEVFSWPAGTCAFREAGEAPSFYDSDVLTTFEQILGGMACMASFEPVYEAMQHLDNRLRLRRPAPIPVEKLTLSHAQGFILSRIDGTATFKNIISTLPPGEDEAAGRFLFCLLIIGVVDYDPPLGDGPFRSGSILRDHADRRALESMQEKTISQAYARIRNQNPQEVLGVAPSATRGAIERAYEEAKAAFSRDRLLPRVRDRFRTELGVIESRLVEAYLQLTQPERQSRGDGGREAPPSQVDVQDLLIRPEFDKTKSRTAKDEAAKVAELYYSKARKAMRGGDFHNAIQYGKLAISYGPDDSRFYFLIADCQVRNPEARWQRMAEQNYTKATELDPWNVDNWLSLGRFYKKRGLSLRARKQFEEVLKLVPGHEEATRELQSIK